MCGCHGVCLIPRVSATQSSDPFTLQEQHMRCMAALGEAKISWCQLRISLRHARIQEGSLELCADSPKKHAMTSRQDVHLSILPWRTPQTKSSGGRSSAGKNSRACASASVRANTQHALSRDATSMHVETLEMLMNNMLMCNRTSAALHRMQALCTRGSSVQKGDLKRHRDPSRLGPP